MTAVNPVELNVSEENFVHKSFFEYFYVLVLIIYAGGANTFVRSFSMDKPLAILIPVVLSGYLIIKKGIKLDKKFYLLMLGCVIYLSAISIKYSEIHPIFISVLLINFFITYSTVKILKFNLFIIYERLVYNLAIIALVMWIIQLISGGDTLYNIAGRIPGIEKFSMVTGYGLNLIFYSIQHSSFLQFSELTIPRNCGFAWEPGGFAAFLCLAIFINIFFDTSKKKSNYHFWILFLALLSTQSTTGYVTFIIIMIFYFARLNYKILILIFPGLIAGLVLLISLPFMGNKILQLYNEAGQTDLIVEQTIGAEITMTPQRFTSFIIAMKDFRENPILGYGGQVEDRWFRKINANVAPISGIGNLLAQYGIVGFLFFSVMVTGSSRFYSKHYKYKGASLFVLIMLPIIISYSIIFLPLIMCFWMFSFFNSDQAYVRTGF